MKYINSYFRLLILLVLGLGTGNFASAQTCVTPVITSISNSGPVCQGGSVTLHATGTVGGVPSSFVRMAGIGGNFGNDEFNVLFSSGDRPGSIARISLATFDAIIAPGANNAAKATLLKAQYDVLMFTWASNQDGNITWGLIEAYLNLGGSVFWDGDYANIGNLSPTVVGNTNGGSSGCSYVLVSPPPFPVLVANGVNGCFANDHLTLTSWPSWMFAYIKASDNVTVKAIAGIYPNGNHGRLIIQGPDQDFHAVRNGANPGGNQYKIMLNQMDFLAANQAGFTWSGPNGFSSNDANPVINNVSGVNAGVYTATLTNTTGGGCFTTATTTVVVNLAPTISGAGNVSANNNPGACNAAVSYSPTISGATSTTHTFSGATSGSGSGTGSGATFNLGTTNVTITASNSCGNTSASFSVTVTDNEAPSINVPAAITISADAGQCTSTASIGTATGSDNCGSVTITHSPAAPYSLGNTTVTWTADDGHGNTTNGTQVVTVVDNEAPSISVPAAVTLSADAGQCSSTASIGTATGSDNCGSVTISHTPSAPYAVGNTTVTWTADDGHGNTTSGTQVVTVTDNEAPSISVPAAVTIGTDVGQCSSTASIGTATGSDNCGSVTITHTPAAPYALGNTTVTWTADDGHGNTTSGTQVVTVVDNEAPSISVPAAVTISADAGQCTSTASIGTATGSDNCGSVTITHTPAAPYALGNTTVTWTADDGHGNTTSGTQVVTVADNEAPSISVPAAITLSADAGICSSSASIGTATGTDNCGSVTISHSPAGPYAVGNTTVTWTANDGHGNTTSGTQVVTVNDNEAPHAICHNYTLNLSGGSGTITAANIDNGSWDNCGIQSMSVSPSSFTCANAGANTVTLTVNDIHGHSSTCTATVTVQYQPTCSISVTPANNTYTGGNPNNIYLGYGPQSATLTAAGTGGSGFTYSWSPGTYLNHNNVANPTFTPTAPGHYTYTVTATNSNGCSTTCTVSMCVVDAVDHSHAGKVILCHLPPGNPNNPQELSISTNAVNDHLTNHTGDHLGPCYGGCSSGPKFSSIVEPVAEAVHVYPNPNEGSFSVVIPVEQKEAVVMITDITGRTVQTKMITDNTGIPVDFNLGKVAPGMYLVRVNAGDYSTVVKLEVR